MKLLSGIAVACVLTFLFLGGCRSQEDASASGPGRKAPLVSAVAAENGPMAEMLETVGEVVATNTVTVGATIEGPIGFCPWREGDLIERAGQKLVEIDRSLYRQEALAAEAALAVAQARLDDLKAGPRPEEIAQAREAVTQLQECTAFTKANLERVEALTKSGAIPGEAAEKARLEYVKCRTQFVSANQELAMLEAGPTKTAVAVQESLVKEAQARLGTAQARLAECVIASPFAGVVSRVFVRPGDLATARAPLLEVMDTSSLAVRFAVPESLAATIRPGAQAAISLEAYPGRTFEAKVQRVYPQVDRQTRTRTAEAVITEPVDLVPGLFARVAVTARQVEAAVIVPDQAVLTTPQKDKIVFVLQQGKAVRRVVTTGLEQGRRVQILQGVQAGESVLVAGHENLRDGAEVRTGKPKGPAAAAGQGGRAQ